MATTPKNYRQVVALALLGLALTVTGLALAALSNPKRFSLNVAEDRNIQLFAISGFVCTLVGIGLFLACARHTTGPMARHFQTRANTGVALGFLLQLGGFFLPDIAPVTIEVGWALILAGVVAFVWGGMHYAQGKGYPRTVGLLAIVGILGFTVLILLKPQCRESVAGDEEGKT